MDNDTETKEYTEEEIEAYEEELEYMRICAEHDIMIVKGMK